MTLYTAVQEGNLRTWVKRTVVDHWLKIMLPLAVFMSAVLTVVLNRDPSTTAEITFLGLFCGWFIAGVGQNVNAWREHRPME